MRVPQTIPWASCKSLTDIPRLPAEPDKSNPTRYRWERPLDTIRAFEAAIDGGYNRKSFYPSAWHFYVSCWGPLWPTDRALEKTTTATTC